jgi:hypothetical protein
LTGAADFAPDGTDDVPVGSIVTSSMKMLPSSPVPPASA